MIDKLTKTLKRIWFPIPSITYMRYVIRRTVFSMIPLRWLIKYGDYRILFEEKVDKVVNFYQSLQAFLMLFEAGLSIIAMVLGFYLAARRILRNAIRSVINNK